MGELDKSICDAICQACDEIMAGQFHDQFICDAIQGGAGTTANMNANEVIANRAIEILGGTKGDYSVVHPNDHVNRAQSTNDVIPTAGKITTIKLLQAAVKEQMCIRDSQTYGSYPNPDKAASSLPPFLCKPLLIIVFIVA